MAETADTLESVPHFLKLGAKKLWVDYDEEVDVGYSLPQLHCVGLLLLSQGLHVSNRLGEFFHEFSHHDAA
jgi:hypothetical protein